MKSIIIKPKHRPNGTISLIDLIWLAFDQGINVNTYHLQEIVLTYPTIETPLLRAMHSNAFKTTHMYTISTSEYMCNPINIKSKSEFKRLKKSFIKSLKTKIDQILDGTYYKSYSQKDIKNYLIIEYLDIEHDSIFASNSTIPVLGLDAYKTKTNINY